MPEGSLRSTYKAAHRLVQKTMERPGIHLEDGKEFLRALAENLSDTDADLSRQNTDNIARIGFNYLDTLYKKRVKQAKETLKEKQEINIHFKEMKELYLRALKEAAEDNLKTSSAAMG